MKKVLRLIFCTVIYNFNSLKHKWPNMAIRKNIVAKKTIELVFLFHKKTTKLVFLWPNMGLKGSKC